jgi:hypothetical protein
MSYVDNQPDPNAKPAMTRREANWHAHVAGMRASEAAADGNPAAADAIMAGSHPRPGAMVAGLHIPPLTIATFWALRDVAKAGDVSGIESQLVSLLAFLDPDAVRAAAKDKDLAWLEDQAYSIARSLSPQAYAEIGRYIGAQMAALESLGGSPDDAPDAPAGKPPAASSAAG